MAARNPGTPAIVIRFMNTCYIGCVNFSRKEVILGRTPPSSTGNPGNPSDLQFHLRARRNCRI